MRKTTRTKKGFTIMEMLVVVAIIAVLAAVLIPTFNGALYKAKAAADIANVRAYYAELQTEYLLTEKYRDEIGDDWTKTLTDEITFQDGSTYKLQEGQYAAIRTTDAMWGGQNGQNGYQVTYFCNKSEYNITFGAQ